MNGEVNPSILKRIDYQNAFRFTRLFSAFRMAFNPSRILLALLFIIIAYIIGLTIDAISDGQPFQDTLNKLIAAFDKGVIAALSLRLGIPAPSTPGPTVISAIDEFFYTIPANLWHTNRAFLIIYVSIIYIPWTFLGGAICRQTMVEASRSRIVGPTEAVKYVWRKWLWFILAPLTPWIIVGLVAFVLAITGEILLYIPVLDMLGGLLYVVALIFGLFMAAIVICWVGSVHLMYPALAAEGTETLDAISRAFGYLIGRPMRLLFYTAVTIIYGALTYLFVGLCIFLAIYLTHQSTGFFIQLFHGEDGSKFFNALFPEPAFGQLRNEPKYDQLSGTEKVAATTIAIWVHLLIGVLAAYIINFYFSAYSIIYLLLRRYHDGTDESELYEPALPAPPPDKVEPAQQPTKNTPDPQNSDEADDTKDQDENPSDPASSPEN